MYPNPNMAPLTNGIFSILISGLWDETDGFYYDHLLFHCKRDSLLRG
jgi:hypothetical protein